MLWIFDLKVQIVPCLDIGICLTGGLSVEMDTLSSTWIKRLEEWGWYNKFYNSLICTHFFHVKLIDLCLIDHLCQFLLWWADHSIQCCFNLFICIKKLSNLGGNWMIQELDVRVKGLQLRPKAFWCLRFVLNCYVNKINLSESKIKHNILASYQYTVYLTKPNKNIKRVCFNNYCWWL